VIERVATEVFAERGYQGASIDEIARRSGVSAPVVYDHFASKQDLFQRLLVRTRDELLAMWREPWSRTNRPPSGSRARSRREQHVDTSWIQFSSRSTRVAVTPARTAAVLIGCEASLMRTQARTAADLP
jgi:AcrR family transcriptional regulator